MLYPASTQAEKTHFHQINKRTGNRLRQQMVDEETGDVVDKEEKGRGYEVSKGKYVEIEEDELAAVQVASTHTDRHRQLRARARRSTSATSTGPTMSCPTARGARRHLRSSATP